MAQIDSINGNNPFDWVLDWVLINSMVTILFVGMVSVKESSCQDLLAAADLLGLTDVVEACCEFLKDQLHPSNAIGT